MEKIYRVKLNSKGMPNFATAEEVADRPQGNVDAVAILMREMHNLDQGYITIGEFDERTEPLRHLCYGRPQGEWTQNVLRPDIHRYECSNCKAHHIERYDYCPSCGARMKGADNEEST